MLMKIGEVSLKTGVHIETIRYYERLKLMPKPDRTQSGHRVYGAEHENRLRFIRRSRGLDFTLKEIRFLLQAAEAENTVQTDSDVTAHAETNLVRFASGKWSPERPTRAREGVGPVPAEEGDPGH